MKAVISIFFDAEHHDSIAEVVEKIREDLDDIPDKKVWFGIDDVAQKAREVFEPPGE